MWLSVVGSLWLILAGGRVRDASTGEPIGGVVVQHVGGRAGTVTDSAGTFRLDVPAGSQLRFSRPGYRELQAPADSVMDVRLVANARALEGVAVTAIRGEGGGGAPITQKVLRQEELERAYSGQEMPLLLTRTPAVTSYADGGAFSNYTYMRIRGMDMTRINITLDGVPLNDAEDQGVFFSNFPDFANSISSVQVQRGVGTSSQGTASYAGSVNFESVALNSAAPARELQLTRGAFNTTRGSAEWMSGSSGRGVSAYARVSAQETDGYRHHSGNRSSGGYGSLGHFGARTSAKVSVLTGQSRNQLAYLASSLSAIERDPRDNPLSSAERDRFRQTVVNASLTHLVGSGSSIAATLYAQSAGGEYDVRIAPDLWNFRLQSSMQGGFVTWNRQAGRLTTHAGAHVSTYERAHAVAIHPLPATELYRNTGEKSEGSVFAKAAIEAGRWRMFADVQARRAWYGYHPDRNAGIGRESITWDFLNPKVGVQLELSPRTTWYASWGMNGREPTRNDMFAGFDNIDTSNVAFVGALSRVRPERVRDFEAGVRTQQGPLMLAAAGFAMGFRNEITPIGALSYIGLPLRKNVRASSRRGVELEARYTGVHNLVVEADLALSRNRIAEYLDDATQQTYHDVEPLLTPTVVTNQRAGVVLWRSLRLQLDGRHVGRSFLANSGDERFTTPAWYSVDAAVTGRVGVLVWSAQLRNVLDKRAFTGGYTDGADPYYFVMAGRNLVVTLRALF